MRPVSTLLAFFRCWWKCCVEEEKLFFPSDHSTQPRTYQLDERGRRGARPSSCCGGTGRSLIKHSGLRAMRFSYQNGVTMLPVPFQNIIIWDKEAVVYRDSALKKKLKWKKSMKKKLSKRETVKKSSGRVLLFFHQYTWSKGRRHFMGLIKIEGCVVVEEKGASASQNRSFFLINVSLFFGFYFLIDNWFSAFFSRQKVPQSSPLLSPSTVQTTRTFFSTPSPPDFHQYCNGIETSR